MVFYVYVSQRKYCKRNLDFWKQLPFSDNVLPLMGVIKADSDCIYEVTNCMSCKLKLLTRQIDERA